MSKYVQWIEYKGKKILFSNYSGLTGAECLEAMEATRQALLKLPAGSSYLGLTDISNTSMSVQLTAKSKELVAVAEEKGLSQKAAIVGGTGLITSVTRLIRPTIHFAKDIEEAKEWLVA
jgi:hypothetical protein